MASSCHGSIGHQSIYLVQQSFCFDFPCYFHHRGRRFGRDDPKDIAYDAEVGGVLYFQDECRRAVNDGLYEVCGYGPAVGALDTAQCVLKVDAEAGRYRGSGSMLA
jgi:hypothetical protein